MTVIFGTLGFTPGKLVRCVSNHEHVTKLVFFHDHHPNSFAAAKEVIAFCRDKGIVAEPHPLDAFDIIECAVTMRRAIRAEGAENVVFNVTAGTPVISSAATLASVLEGTRAVYIDERNGSEISLPLLSMRYEEVLGPECRRVLAAIAKHKDKGTVQTEIGKALNLARATVSHHVKSLKLKQLVTVSPHPDDGRREILRARPSASLLLMDDDEAADGRGA